MQWVVIAAFLIFTVWMFAYSPKEKEDERIQEKSNS